VAKKVIRIKEEDKVYEELRQRMNRLSFGAPRGPEEMKLLKMFFPTIEEAEIALHLDSQFFRTAKSKTADEIAAETGKDIAKVQELLDKLARRGSIKWKEKEGEPGVKGYFLVASLMSLAIWAGVTPGLHTPEGKALNEQAVKVFKGQLTQERSPSKYPISRTLTVDTQIDATSKVLPYETVRGVIRRAVENNLPIFIDDCGCRIRERKCNHKLDTCIHFGWSVSPDRPSVSEEEALKVLDESAKEGLVPTTWNNTDPAGASGICMCCSCCCYILGGYARNNTGWGNPHQTMRSNFEPQCDREKCTLCELCVKKCPVNALWHHYPHKPDLSDDFIFLENERCIGCGVCAYICPTHALTMVKVRDFVPEPDLPSMWEKNEREARH
jgi:Pyruvate/2-oxoacid:ferredoxin oxidoreductase delta subunit